MPSGVEGEGDDGELQPYHGQAHAPAEVVVVSVRFRGPAGQARGEDVVVRPRGGKVGMGADLPRPGGRVGLSHGAGATGPPSLLLLLLLQSPRPSHGGSLPSPPKRRRCRRRGGAVVPVPNPDLEAEASARDDVGLGGMVLDGPGGAGMSLEAADQPPRQGAGDLDGVIAVRAGQRRAVGTEGERDGGDGRSGRSRVSRERVGHPRRRPRFGSSPPPSPRRCLRRRRRR